MPDLLFPAFANPINRYLGAGTEDPPVLRYAKVRAGAYDPVRANPGDAGIDFFIPKHIWEKNPETRKGMIQLEPGARVLIPSGIRVEVPLGYALIFQNKSGISTKFGLVVGAAVVDHAYENEVHLHVINTNNENPVWLEEGDKIVQGVLIPVGLHPLVETPLEDMWAEERTIKGRGKGGFGSSGTKAIEIDVDPKEVKTIKPYGGDTK